MKNDNSFPSRRIGAEINIGADSWRDLHDSLHAVIRELFEAAPNDENFHWVSNTECSGIDLSVSVDHSMTHEKYVERIKAYTADEKNLVKDKKFQNRMEEAEKLFEKILSLGRRENNNPIVTMMACAHMVAYIGVEILGDDDKNIQGFFNQHLKAFSFAKLVRKRKLQ